MHKGWQYACLRGRCQINRQRLQTGPLIISHFVALLELDDKERRLARWGSVLSGFARPGSRVVASPWIDRTVTQPVDDSGATCATA